MMGFISTILQRCVDLFELCIVLLQLAWNLYMFYLTCKIAIFVINNAVGLFILVIICPSILTSSAMFIRNAFVEINAGKRG
jgi:hypothetical protein